MPRTAALDFGRGRIAYVVSCNDSFRLCLKTGKAISRNAILIAVGFLPLLASPLVPYNTVGLFLAAIMAASGVVTLGLLPGVVHLMRGRLFAGTGRMEIEP